MFKTNIIIKFIIFFYIFCNLIYSPQLSVVNWKCKNCIEIDNKIIIKSYENNINFSSYSTDIKAIAFFFPNNINYYNNIRKKSYKANKTITDIIKEQTNLAKNHGIYGFGIYYDLFGEIDNKVLDIFFENEIIDFSFMIIWKNENYFKQIQILNDNILNDIELLENELNKFIKKIKKYLISKQYIKINQKPVLSLNEPLIVKNIDIVISILRKKSKENGIGEIFFLFPLTSINDFSSFKYLKSFNAAYESLKKDFNNNNLNYLGVIYKNLLFNNLTTNFTIYRSSMLEINNSSDQKSLKNYSPRKYFILNKIIIDWTNEKYKYNKIIFINSWNNYQEGNYLEPDNQYGYSSINSFSKALFNKAFKENDCTLTQLNNRYSIAVQAHVFYEDLIEIIIDKTNNIPKKFDLFITTTTLFKKKIIEKYVQKKSLANKYEIKIISNKGRDVLPFIIQMKEIFKNYKYICHIHTKKSLHNPFCGKIWRNYLFENLLGNKEIVCEILTEFENYEKLGLVFPETHYNIIPNMDYFYSSKFIHNKPNIKYMNYILKNLTPRVKVGNKLIFPMGNMFWAKVEAIHQIFELKIFEKFPKELNQTNGTIMHAIERIWLYLVKLNGFYFNMIFKYY